MDLLEMLEGCRTGHEAAWEAFVGWFSMVSTRVLAGFPNLHPIEREEAAAHARFKIVGEIRNGRLKATYPGELVNFVRVVVKREAIDRGRGRGPHEGISADLPDRSLSAPSARAESRLRLDCIEKLLLTETEDTRLIVVMKMNGVPTEVIRAELANSKVYIDAATVDGRFHRFKKHALKACA